MPSLDWNLGTPVWNAGVPSSDFTAVPSTWPREPFEVALYEEKLRSPAMMYPHLELGSLCLRKQFFFFYQKRRLIPPKVNSLGEDALGAEEPQGVLNWEILIKEMDCTCRGSPSLNSSSSCGLQPSASPRNSSSGGYQSP